MTIASPRIYNLFPLLAGPFADWSPHLQRAAAMGFDWLYFNPVSYPGFSGSLYSVKDHYGFHPVLAPDGDEAAHEAFAKMLQTSTELGLSPMMDLVIGHTAIDCELITTHPDWFEWQDGDIVHPGALENGKWVAWGDLAQVNNRPGQDALWDYWDRLITHHQGLGVRGFRCDAAYQIPPELWRYLIERARQRDPDTLFVAETLGCPIEDVMTLAEAGFSHTFNSVKWWDFAEPWCLTQQARTRTHARTIGFAESHDTPRLAAELKHRGAVLMRYAFSAWFSSGVMMPMGLEAGLTAPLHVVTSRPEQWQPRLDMSDAIGQVNRLKGEWPILADEGRYEMLNAPKGQVWLQKMPDLHGPSALFCIAVDGGQVSPPELPGMREITPPGLTEASAPLQLFILNPPQSTGE